MLTADCVWISVEASPVSVTRTVPSISALQPSTDATTASDSEDTPRLVTISRSLAAHLDNDIVVLSLHTHLHMVASGKASSETEPPSLDMSAFPEGTIVGVRWMYSDWPVVQLTDAGGLPADPFILPALAPNQCASTGTSSISFAGAGDSSSGALVSVVRK